MVAQRFSLLGVGERRLVGVKDRTTEHRGDAASRAKVAVAHVDGNDGGFRQRWADASSKRQGNRGSNPTEHAIPSSCRGKRVTIGCQKDRRNVAESSGKRDRAHSLVMATGLTVPERTSRVVAADLEISILGECSFPSPLANRLAKAAIHYVGKADRVLLDDRMSRIREHHADLASAPAFELAGPRHKIFFDPARLRCGIVTCGGLCPGLNNVIRGLVLELTQSYGVAEIFGFRYGYEGVCRKSGHGPVRLSPTVVADIHHAGGTALGTSRGDQDPAEMADRLDDLGIGVLFVIGGDGTFRGAMTLVAEIERRGLPIGVIGIPKTIDNDIHFIDRSFGFETAFSAAVDVIRSAHVEATGAKNGIGVVKLMGRHSGFIACHAALASTDVDVVLIPEVPLRLEESSGLLELLEARLDLESHALIVVAEGAGSEPLVE